MYCTPSVTGVHVSTPWVGKLFGVQCTPLFHYFYGNNFKNSPFATLDIWNKGLKECRAQQIIMMSTLSVMQIGGECVCACAYT